MADNAAKIEELSEAIESGVTRTATDGLVSEFDLTALERARRELRQSDPASIAAGRVRPTILGVNLSGAW